MKKLIKRTLLCMFSFTLLSFVTPINASAITIIVGTKCRPDGSGNGCAGDKGVCIIIKAEIYRGGEIPLNHGIANVKIVKDKIRLTFTKINNDDPSDSYFDVLDNYSLGQEISEMLGLKNVILLKGSYVINYKENRYGVVDIEFNDDTKDGNDVKNMEFNDDTKNGSDVKNVEFKDER